MTDNYVDRNRETWSALSTDFAKTADREWAGAPAWGLFLIPEAEVGFFPADVAGLDTIELGCGTAYVSAWLARLGANPIGIDVTPAQLETARLMQEKYGIAFPLVEGNAEATPFADASCDLVVSEYGASIWCDPYKWIPEAYRLLRPGGRLRFLRGHPLAMMCTHDDETIQNTSELLRPQNGLYRLDWGPDGVEFTLPHGKMIELLIQTGFEIEKLRELYAQPDATTTYPYVSAEWASKWPHEEVWKVRKPLS